MITIFFNKTLKKVEISFSGIINFHDTLTLCKEENLIYAPETKTWLCESKKFLDKELLSYFEEIERVNISDIDLKLIEEDTQRSEIKRLRIRYNKDLVNFEPLEGISPHETYQLDDIKRFLSYNRGGVYWEQRLGKMIWLVVHMTHLFANKKIDKALILTPSSGVFNSRNEILKFSKFFNSDDIKIADKDNREPFSDDTKIVICTYRTFLLISDHYYKLKNKKISKKYRNPVIPFNKWGESRAIYADESQELGNPMSRQSKVIHIHKQFFEYRYLLSGTPGSAVEKYYSQITFLDKNIIPYSYNDFLSIIGNVGNRFSKYQLNYLYPDKVEKFLNSIKPYISRRLLKDHLKISPDYIKKIYIHLNKRQKLIYEELTKVVIKELKEDNNGQMSLQKVKTKFPYISLALQNPTILEKSFEEKEVYNFKLLSAIKNWKFEYHSKLEVLDELVYKTFETEEKLIIWGGHPDSLSKIAERYNKYNPIIIHGSIKTKGKTTEQLKSEGVDKFNNDKSTKLLVVNYMSLSTQVSLTKCNTQIFFDRGWDYVSWAQSKKRIQGNNQLKSTTSYVLIIENSLEEEQDLTLENRSLLNDFAFNRNALDLDTWKKIFNGKGV